MEIKETFRKQHILKTKALSESTLTKELVFSPRELDVISCLLNDMPSKKVASILSLSTSTIESHIRNILAKTGYSSRKEVIEFIKKSNLSRKMQKHFDNLLLTFSFEQEINKLPKPSSKLTCVVLYFKSSQTKDPLTDQLVKHLNITGIPTTSKAWTKGRSVPYISSISKANTTTLVIYNVADAPSEKILELWQDLQKEVAELNTLQDKSSSPTTFLLLKENNCFTNPLPHAGVLTFKQGSYYSSFFCLLKKLLPQVDISKNISSFIKQLEAHDGSKSPFLLKEEEHLTTNMISTKKNNFSKRKLILTALLALVISIVILKLPLRGDSKYFNIKTNLLEPRGNILLNIPPRNGKFTGRTQYISQLKQQIKAQPSTIVTQVISGPAGIGKTQTAMEFAYQQALAKESSMILWIPAETTNSIYDAYQEIAQHLQLDAKGMRIDDLQSLVHYTLANNHQNSKILFILDNAPSYQNSNHLLIKIHKQLSPYLAPHVLITTRSQHWPEGTIILNSFTQEEAFKYVQKHLPQEEIDAINELNEKLSYFPLALSQAVAYIKSHTNINDYLKLYATKQKDFLKLFPEDKNQYNSSLWKTWDIAINKLSTPAREMLFISAYLNPDDIPLDFFENLSVEERSIAINELKNYSFITMTSNKTFKIHRLLQEVIRISIKHRTKYTFGNHSSKAKDYWLNKTLTLLKAKFDFNFLKFEEWKDWSNYLTHAQTVAINSTTASGETLQQSILLYVKYAMFLTCTHLDPKQAITSWQQISSLIQQHYQGDIKNLLVANLNSSLAYAFNNSGKDKNTKELLKDNLSIYKQPPFKVKKEERDLLDSMRVFPFQNESSEQTRKRCDLATYLTMIGMAEHSLGFMQKASTAYQEALGTFLDEPLDEISQIYKRYTLEKLGVLYIHSGNFVGAEALLKKASPEQVKMYSKHPGRAYYYSNMAWLMYHIGNFQASAQQLSKCSKIRTSALSPQHFRHADTHTKQGYLNLALGNFTEAENDFIHAESIYRLSLEDSAGEYIFTKLGLWKTYEKLGNYTAAKNYMEKTREISIEHYGNNINQAMTSFITQAEAWPKLPKANNTPYWREALKTNIQLFGKTHYQTARCHYLLGQSLQHENAHKEAFFHYQQSLDLLKAQKINHPNLELFKVKNIEAIQSELAKALVHN